MFIESIEAKEQASYALIDSLRFKDPSVNCEQFGAILPVLDGLSSSILDNLLEAIPTNAGVLRGSEQKLVTWSGTQYAVLFPVWQFR